MEIVVYSFRNVGRGHDPAGVLPGLYGTNRCRIQRFTAKIMRYLSNLIGGVMTPPYEVVLP